MVGESGGGIRQRKHRCMYICGWLVLGRGVCEFQCRRPRGHEGEHDFECTHEGDIIYGGEQGGAAAELR